MSPLNREDDSLSQVNRKIAKHEMAKPINSKLEIFKDFFTNILKNMR
jgi:hypothetical protein